MRGQGVEVVYLEDLTAEVLKSNVEIKKQFISEFIEEGIKTHEKVKKNFFHI